MLHWSFERMNQGARPGGEMIDAVQVFWMPAGANLPSLGRGRWLT
jgi:hypothetical protein